MYTCVRAIVCPRGVNARFSETQVGGIAVRDLLTQNMSVQLVLKHPAINHEVGLNLTTVADLIYSIRPDITVNDWLFALGNKTLPTTDTVLKKTVSLIRYNDAFMAGYHLNRQHPLAAADSQLPDSELTDILMTKNGITYKELYESCLISVNGLLHLTDYSTRGLRVKDAGQSVRYANKNSIGMISFREVGKLSFFPIKGDSLKPFATDAPLKNGFTISLPNVDLSNKIAMLSIGGVLHFADDCYRVTGDHSILVEWWKIPFAHRYFDAEPFIDMRTFEATLVRNPRHGSALDLDQAMTDASIRAYMELSQTFLILLEADHFYYERHATEMTGLQGRYYSYERPDLPLQLENGFLPPYVATPENGVYVIALDDNLIPRYVHDTKPITDDHYFNKAKRSSRPGYYSAGYLLEMGREYLSA